MQPRARVGLSRGRAAATCAHTGTLGGGQSCGHVRAHETLRGALARNQNEGVHCGCHASSAHLCPGVARLESPWPDTCWRGGGSAGASTADS